MMKSIIPLILTAMFVVACSESKNPPEEKKEDASVVVEEKRQSETDLHEASGQIQEKLDDVDALDSVDELKLKKIMESDKFKKLKQEQMKYNDSLDRANVKNMPRRPGPEGVLRSLMIKCKKEGNCPNE